MSLYHDRYILHGNNTDFVTILVAPSEKQLSAFRNYTNQFLDMSMGERMFSDKKSSPSELDLIKTISNNGEISFTTKGGARFSTIYFALGAESAEGKHGNITIVDEAKFVSPKNLRTSLTPTVAGRNGTFLMISSASEEWCVFQDIVEKNIDRDIIDNQQYDIPLKTSGEVDLNFEFNGRRHFQQHWEKMIKQRDSYALTIDRELDSVSGNRDHPSFASQYDNRFLSKKSSSFFDLGELKAIVVFQAYNWQKYINDSKFLLVSGWDVAVTGDSSILTIKALENGFGKDRKTYLVAQIMLNISKSKQIDSVYNQTKSVLSWLQKYDIVSCVIDESGVGKSATSYIKDAIDKYRIVDINKNYLVDVVFGEKNRSEILDFYWTRVQSGLEIFPFIEEKLFNEENLRSAYINYANVFSEEAMWVKFLYEHVKFARTITKDENGKEKVVFRQATETFLKDDTIFASALCSWILNKFPEISSSKGSRISVKRNFGRKKKGRV